MIYTFADEQGNEVELEFDMGKCPVATGDTLTLEDGRRVTRTFPQSEHLPRVKCLDRTHEAFHLPSLRHGRDPDVPRYSKAGNGFIGDFPLFTGIREIREYEAKKAAKGSTMRYDL